MRPSRLSFDETLTLWRAREVYRVQAVLRGLLVLFFCCEFLTGFMLGHWWFGPLLVGLQWALLWCLCWVFEWCLRPLAAAIAPWLNAPTSR